MYLALFIESPLPQGILADFAPSIPPLVPHLVVQCVNQVEKRGLQEVSGGGGIAKICV